MGTKVDRLIKRLITSENPHLTPNPHLLRYSFTTNLLNNLDTTHKSILTTQTQKPNLTATQTHALINLKRNPSITIKPVDKNLGVAVIEKSLYKQLAEVHLTDTTTYKQLTTDPLSSTITHITNTLTTLQRHSLITRTQLCRMIPSKNCTPGNFYILPKLHKKTLESRPIVSNVSHPTKNISQFLHNTMISTAQSAKSYIKNSNELTDLLKDIPATPHTFIITADIKSLYTLIPNDEGVKNVVKEMSGKTKVQAKALDTLLKLVLQNNIFKHGENSYIQENGTAMGTIMAPTYANVYLKSKEEKTLLNQAVNPYLKNIKLFKRYIDDICIIYDNADNSMVDFIKLLKQAYEPLELTVKVGRQDQVFLDTEISIGSTSITTQLHVKPLSNKTYIPPSSQHPPHMLKNIIYNDLLRVNRLCSEPMQRNKHELNFLAKAKRAGYEKKTLLTLRKLARKKLKTPRPTEEKAEPPTILALTYNGESTEKLASVLKETWKTHANPSQRVMVAYRTHSNLKKLTVRSKFTPCTQ